jgi:predicted nucleotidyltransferase
MEKSQAGSLKQKVAREAALLLYMSQEKEYKQAKRRAAENLGTRMLPSNLEVARQLDAIAEEMEGSSRRKRLVQMRREALKIMKTLEKFNPRLIGSIWRGTITKNSDIDIVAFAPNPDQVQTRLQKNGFSVVRTELTSVTKKDRKETAFHIFLALPSGNEAEVVVRPADEVNNYEKCEIYGDLITGLNTRQLAKLLKENPLKRFVP